MTRKASIWTFCPRLARRQLGAFVALAILSVIFVGGRYRNVMR
ncbi:hypothetical protein [Prescottella agglutinans]